MRRAVLGAVLAVGAAAGTAACGIPTDERPMLAEHEDVPFDLLDEATTTSSTTSTVGTARPPRTVDVCFFDGPTLVVVARESTAPRGDLAAVVELLETPQPSGVGRQLSTAVADASMVASVTASGGVAQLDLARAFVDAGATEQRRMVTQLVCTLTSQPGVGGVAFSLDGGPVEVPTGDGSLTADPVTRDDYAELIG